MKRLLVALSLLLPCLARAAENSDVLAHLRTGHPRLLFTDDQLATALADAKTDPLRARLHAAIVALAEGDLKKAPIQHVLVGPRLLDQSRACIARVLNGAMAYRLTGDKRFAERAKKELFTAAAFPDWNPSHFLDVAEMSFAVAIGYDWLYRELTPEERATLKAAMLKHGLAFAAAAYASDGPTDKRVWFVTAHHNWNQVCNGGLLAAALALADEEPALARFVVAGARRSLPLAMSAYQPDGAYPEGPGYWSYGTTYNVLAIALLESALGTDLGLTAAPAFDRTLLYRLYVQSPTGLVFNYADGGAGTDAQPEFTWLARQFHSSVALAQSRELLADAISHRMADRFSALHAVWFPAIETNAPPPPPLDAQFHGPAELAIFRSAWNDPRALFVGFKAGRNDVNHAHLDLGSFVLDADGVRWAHDLGPDNYNLPGYFDSKSGKRWNYYRLENHSHNTIAFGRVRQPATAVAPITVFRSTPPRACAVADLTAAYPGTAKKILRGIALLDRAQVLVQDEVVGLGAPTPITWRLLTTAQVQIADAHHAMLTTKGRTLRIEIIAPADGALHAAPASPPTADENQNKGTTDLTFTLSAPAGDARLVVLLTPVGDHWPAELPRPTVTPLAEW
jgi:hypothetical protein